MNTINASNARQNFFNLLADTSLGDPTLITSKGGNRVLLSEVSARYTFLRLASKGGNCVLLSEEEWNSIQETIFLLSNPKTRNDILMGIKTPLLECKNELVW